jgi:hypothetical protein
MASAVLFLLASVGLFVTAVIGAVMRRTCKVYFARMALSFVLCLLSVALTSSTAEGKRVDQQQAQTEAKQRAAEALAEARAVAAAPSAPAVPPTTTVPAKPPPPSPTPPPPAPSATAPSTKEEGEDGEDPATAAEKMSLVTRAACQSAIEEGAKDPDSLQWPGVIEQGDHPEMRPFLGKDGKWHWNSWFSATNSFGARIRSKFRCTLDAAGTARVQLL